MRALQQDLRRVRDGVRVRVSVRVRVRVGVRVGGARGCTYPGYTLPPCPCVADRY